LDVESSGFVGGTDIDVEIKQGETLYDGWDAEKIQSGPGEGIGGRTLFTLPISTWHYGLGLNFADNLDFKVWTIGSGGCKVTLEMEVVPPPNDVEENYPPQQFTAN
jgi:hypothetical protein